MNWFDFHTKGDPNCTACAVAPTLCSDCGQLVHTHFEEELEAIEGKCEGCNVKIDPSALEVVD